jgi:hypothetical protein
MESRVGKVRIRISAGAEIATDGLHCFAACQLPFSVTTPTGSPKSIVHSAVPDIEVPLTLPVWWKSGVSRSKLRLLPLNVPLITDPEPTGMDPVPPGPEQNSSPPLYDPEKVAPDWSRVSCVGAVLLQETLPPLRFDSDALQVPVTSAEVGPVPLSPPQAKAPKSAITNLRISLSANTGIVAQINVREPPCSNGHLVYLTSHQDTHRRIGHHRIAPGSQVDQKMTS